VRWPWARRVPEDPGVALLRSLGAVEMFAPLSGRYVYGLVGLDGKVFYVGQSENIMTRLGAHLKTYGDNLASVLLVKVASEWSMTVTEDFLIDRVQPAMNVYGMADEADRVRARMARRQVRTRDMRAAKAEQKAVAGE
jgi:excinuclease UvrABC nuclease subunit